MTEKQLEERNAIIESVSIRNDEHGCLSAYLHLDYGGSGQSFGGYALYVPREFINNENTANYAGHFIWRIMEVAGVDEWAELAGKTIRVKAQRFGRIKAIGNIVKDDWFYPEIDFDKMMAIEVEE